MAGSPLNRKLLKFVIKNSSEWLEEAPAVLGNLSGVVSTGVNGMVYARMSNGQVISAYNRIAPLVLDLQVIVGRSKVLSNVWQVIVVRESYLKPAANGAIADHAAQHIFPASDTVFVDRKQLMTANVLVADKTAFTVQLYGAVVKTADGMVLIDNQIIDLSSYIPSDGAVYISIECDDAGVVSINNTGTPMLSSELVDISNVPVPASGKYCIAFVLMYELMPELLDSFISIPYPLAGAGGGGGGGTVESITGDGVDNTDPANPVISYPTPGDIGAEPALGYTPVPDTRTVNGHALSADVTVSKSDVSLGSVDDVQQLPMSYLDTDGTLAANSDAKVSSQKAVKTYVDAAKSSAISISEAYADSLVVGLWDDRGSFDASVNAYPSSGGSGTAGAILKGDVWTISVAGTLPTGQVVEIGDLVRALINTPGNTQANWAITQNNIGYTAENIANKDTDTALAANSDTKYASQKAVKSYIDSASSNASVIAKVLTGFAAGAGTVSASDSILSAFQKVVGNIALKLTANSPITGATKTKITYDANGLVTAGADVTDADISTSDITTNDASTSKHGFLKKLSNVATQFMNGAGSWSAITIPIPLSAHGLNATIPGSTINYIAPGSTTLALASQNTLVTVAGTLKNCYIRIGAQPASGSLVVKVRVNNVATSIVITIPLSSGAGTYSDLTHTASVVAGDLVGFELTNNATGASAAISPIVVENDISNV